MATHTIASGSMAQAFAALPTMKSGDAPAPTVSAYIESNLMEIIQQTCPGKSGINLLFSLAGGLEFRVAGLAAMMTNVMGANLLAHPTSTIDKLNDGINALDEIKNRAWAFDQAGLSQPTMMRDLMQLRNFLTTVQLRIYTVKNPGATPKAKTEADRIAEIARWKQVIELASKPQTVEEWKLELSWDEYKEECAGKTEMSEEEHRTITTAMLGGKAKEWNTYANQIIDTIDNLPEEVVEFDDLSVDLQRRLLTAISSDKKEKAFRTNAMKFSKTIEELHAARMLVSDFCKSARAALALPKFDESYVEPEADAEAAAERSDKRHRVTHAQQALDNADAFEYAA